MNLSAIGTVIRRRAESGTAPLCDDLCRRWGTRPHAHMCPDGLYNDDSPFLTLSTYCSCGEIMDGPLRIDVREPGWGEIAEDAGNRSSAAFGAHMLTVHGIDVEKDQDWLKRATTPP